MMLVTISVIVAVITENLYYRNAATHSMPGWVQTLFIETLPRSHFHSPQPPSLPSTRAC